MSKIWGVYGVLMVMVVCGFTSEISMSSPAKSTSPHVHFVPAMSSGSCCVMAFQDSLQHVDNNSALDLDTLAICEHDGCRAALAMVLVVG